jgi:hypothetical protein
VSRVQQWEYKVVRYLKDYTVVGHETRGLPYFNDLLLCLGKEGWEVVSWHEGQTEVMLKRPLNSGTH